MKNKKEWETKSLEWIHRVREEIDQEIKEKRMTLSQWIKARGKIDSEALSKHYKLKNLKIISKVKKSRSEYPETSIRDR